MVFMGGDAELIQVLRMNGGTKEASYANNSSLQKAAISKARHIVENMILDLYCTTAPSVLSIADLGCSSGPNTLMVISEIMDAVHFECSTLSRPFPEFRVFLNDLPTNDFNAIFSSLPNFYENLRKEKGGDFGPCYIMGVPGSFYGRLFPNKSLQIVHSSYSVHWLSQVPPMLRSENGKALNKGHIYVAKTSPPLVYQVYLEQFKKDFSSFLKLRSEEIIGGGKMVLTLLGRRSGHPSSKGCAYNWELLAQALNDMVSQGIVEEAEVNSFNMPFYLPSIQELKDVIESEGSFNVNELEAVEVNWDPSDDESGSVVFDEFKSGHNVAQCIRAVAESMLTTHFGESIIDDLFERYKDKVIQHLRREKTKHINLVVSMTKR